MARRPRLDRELERYLVSGETVIVAVRRHWFHLAREIAMAVAATVLAFWVDVKVPRTPGGEVLHNLSLAIWWVAVLWLVWRFLNWRHDWFVATDKRFLLFYGFIRRKVAMMPLMRVTDMTFDRSVLGRIVGYGMFVLESAGQKQALSVIDHVPDADRHYRAICTQLFGAESQVRVHTRGFAPPEDDDGTSGGGPGGAGGPGGPRGGGAGGPDRPGGGGSGGPGGSGPRRPGGGDRDRGYDDPTREPVVTPAHRPESWYRSSNLRGPNHLGDTGEIPVVRVRRDDTHGAGDVEGAEGADEVPLYPPPHWSR
ncbi:PH domain-containing protein [Oryzobacter terrae]|uniref:PH domain-containing protein n=1 Tax=Oryzobacter terrae TaxID=1620385 RepID=UPI00366BD367